MIQQSPNEGPQAILRRLCDYLDAPQLAARIIADTERLGARIVTPQDPEWPGVLDDLTPARRPAGATEVPAPPLCLWVRSARPLPDLLDRAVAVVGSRAATHYGQHVASELGHGLAERGWSVLNAGGYGIEAAALRGALTGGDQAVDLCRSSPGRRPSTPHRPARRRLDLPVDPGRDVDARPGAEARRTRAEAGGGRRWTGRQPGRRREQGRAGAGGR